jgi:putative phage-type endonuclease
MTPPYRLLGRYEVESAEWHAARRNRLGGSEIAAVMGLSPYESRFSLWHRKRGTVGPQEMNREMDWGRRLEPVVLDKYIGDHSASNWGRYLPSGTFVNEARPYQVANPDLLLCALDTDRVTRVIEAKTSPFGEGWGRGDDDIPVYYRCQVLWYMDVFEVDIADVCVLISGCDYREYTVRYDPADALLMRAAAEEFLASVAANQRPDIDGHDQTYHVIKALHPQINGEKVDAPPDLVAEFVESRAAQQAADTRFSTARSQLADLMGDAKAVYAPGVPINGKPVSYKIADRRVKNGGTPYLQAASKLPTRQQLLGETT